MISIGHVKSRLYAQYEKIAAEVCMNIHVIDILSYLDMLYAISVGRVGRTYHLAIEPQIWLDEQSRFIGATYKFSVDIYKVKDKNISSVLDTYAWICAVHAYLCLLLSACGYHLGHINSLTFVFSN